LTIGDVIRYIRQTNNLSQEDMAEKIGSSQYELSRVERGRIDPDRTLLNRIANTFDSEVVKAYICGIRDKQYIEFAINESRKTGQKTYA